MTWANSILYIYNIWWVLNFSSEYWLLVQKMHLLSTGCYGYICKTNKHTNKKKRILKMTEKIQISIKVPEINSSVNVTSCPVRQIHRGMFTQQSLTCIISKWWPGHDQISTCSDGPQFGLFPPGLQMLVCTVHWAWVSVLCDLNAYSFISRLWHIYHVLLSGKVPLGWPGQHGLARRWCSVTDEAHFCCGGCVTTQGLLTDLK